ncbi:MAG: hypothetical protein U9N45_02680, partial [Gemmatimonadota bacterium]|nr:hypothetical protein [Gemmatimonadota bacterium]
GPWLEGRDGVFIWAYNWPGGGHAWNDFDSPVMDWMLSYRDLDDRYIPTPAWEGVREGIEDRCYILTLERLISTFPAHYVPAQEARWMLARLPYILEAGHRELHLERFPAESPPSTDTSPMGAARRLIAGHIIRLVRDSRAGISREHQRE